MKTARKIIQYTAGAAGAIIALLFLLGLLYSPDLEIPPGIQGRHVEIDGMRIRVHQAGSGRDVVFLHGGMGSLEDFESLFRVMTGAGKTGYRLTAFDRPGMGYSELKGRAFSLEGAADVTLKLIAELKLRDVILVGHSYGGGIALTAAARNPESIKAYVLIAPAAYAPDGFYRENESLVMRLLRIPAMGTGLAMCAGPLLGGGMIAKVIDPMSRRGNGRLREGFPANFTSFRRELWNKAISTTTRARQSHAYVRDMPAIAARYKNIRAPVTLVIGRDDMPILRAFVPRLKKDVKQIRVTTLPDVNHYPQFERPRAIAELIRAAGR